ncbi:hypothetical protein [Paracoccus contaminans]|uniref:Uncharacterized protein n=1 Tax=Paracoccus contaminans TaxID=1945662 RepID=A0A1W6CZY7_9RHOB|nr:hypothetical protein [Paracoccus contaminans]ARJ70443.1 hypothetical protein B0A89_13155 [Paracoccus contaminans]
MQIDRADMKLMIEAGYSGLMRGIDTDLKPIFDAIAEWMPQYAAGPIGQALLLMTRGEFAEADRRLTEIIGSALQGRDEARAVLAMCKTLQNEHEQARQLAEQLQGTGGYAEGFADALVNGGDEMAPPPAGGGAETGAKPQAPVALVSGDHS